MINGKTLLDNDYKEYSKEASMNQYCNRFFQKRFRNYDGDTKYFITIYEYDKIGFESKLDYEIELQFEKDNYTMNITMFCIAKNMTIAELEKEVNDIWYNLDCKYYEKNE